MWPLLHVCSRVVRTYIWLRNVVLYCAVHCRVRCCIVMWCVFVRTVRNRIYGDISIYIYIYTRIYGCGRYVRTHITLHYNTEHSSRYNPRTLFKNSFDSNAASSYFMVVGRKTFVNRSTSHFQELFDPNAPKKNSS